METRGDRPLTLITGGTGFIGQKLANRLIEHGERVRLLVRKTSNVSPFAGKPVELAYGDVTDRTSVKAALTGCKRLYHLANVYDWWIPNYTQYYRVNVEGTRNVLEAAMAAGVEKTVYTSTYATLGCGENTKTEDTSRSGPFLCEYERTKYLGEQEALKLAQEGLPLVVVMPTGVYGPGDTKITGRLLAAYLNRRLPALINMRTNMVFVDDVVEGHIAAMERGRPGEKYIMGGENASSRDVLSLVAEMEGRRWIPPTIPHWMGMAAGLFYEMGAKLTGKPPLISRDFVRFFSKPLCVSNEKACTQLGVSFTPLREGLRRHIEWLKETGEV